jgi:hypothetical protein
MDEMGRARSTLDRYIYKLFGVGNLKEGYHVEHPDIYRKVILN